MNQPELGKKISDLRKAKGLTQEELVEKCNINVRTLQRIEAGEVTPRSYTVRLIFSALNAQWNDSIDKSNDGKSGEDNIGRNWLEQVYKYVFELFDLRTNTMKKITILIAIAGGILFGVLSIQVETQAQNVADVKKVIDASNVKFVRWFNNDQFDSLLTIYTDDACMVGKGCGKKFIGSYHRAAAQEVSFKSLKSSHVTLSDSLAVEEGVFTLTLNSGEEVSGEYLTEWVYRNKRWLIRKDLPTIKRQ